MATPTSVTDEQIHAAQAGDEDAMWQIVSAYEPMVRGIVRSVAPAATADEAEDMLQEARIVLIQHVREYSTDASSAQLHSYAYRALRRAVADEWLRSTTTLSVGSSGWAAYTVKRALYQADGDANTAWSIVSGDADPRRRMSREAFVGVCEALMEVLPLDAPIGRSAEGGAQSLADTIPDSAADVTDVTERRRLARHLLGEIPQRQAFALRAFYGIGMEVMTDAQAADDLGVKPAVVRPLRTRGAAAVRRVAHRDGLSVAA
ncbi:RNA polymerase sigma factor [Streptomyces halstedii]|uniref:RNA polymerase sigma factor n=1 Tax=Streptomyces halstedii TaxID=1944 RepID=UPI0037FC807F